ncbi:MAG: ATP-binding cassette domain-containing protein [bacterium]
MKGNVKFENINLNFYNKKERTEVLKDLTLDIEHQKITAIIGPSGCGKSTILNILSGLLIPDSGTIICNEKVGYMFQKDNLLDWLNVLDNVVIGLKISKELTKEKIDYAKELLIKYNLEEFIYRYPKELSGGMRQRVALIRSLVTNPTLLLLDEPFSALDAQTKISVSNDIYKIIKNLNITTILVTHDISEAISMADEINVLTNRPACLNKKYIVNLTSEEDNPVEKRKAIEFKEYFDKIWSDLS